MRGDDLAGWDAVVVEGRARRAGMYVYIYRRFTLLYLRSFHNIVKQLYSKKKEKTIPLICG